MSSSPPPEKKRRAYVEDEDPGLIFYLANDDAIHLGCGLPSSPVTQGNTPADSARNFRVWLEQLIAANGGATHKFITGRAFQIPNSLLYHQMPKLVTERIRNELSNYQTWGTDILSSPIHSFTVFIHSVWEGIGLMVLWIITNYRHFVRPTVLSILHLNKTRDNKCNCSIGMERLLVTMKVAPNQILKTSSLAESDKRSE